MRLRQLTMIMLALGLLATAGLAGAAIPESERVPVTDPAELEAMGLEPDAENVYRWVHAVTEAAPADAPEEFGDKMAYTSISARVFVPGDYRFDMGNFSGGQVFCHDSGAQPFLNSQIDLPDGARMFGVRAWAYDDNSSEDVHLWVYEICQPDMSSGNPSSTTLLDDGLTVSSAGHQSRYWGIAGGLTADTSSCVYNVRIRLGTSSSGCYDTSLRLQKVRAYWAREVSPAPATATFSDVPTSHDFFRHIEALADSGITSGCGESTYCPDAPLTRGQMAVFLSKALGLHWDLANH